MNDYDWWADKSKEAAIENYCEWIADEPESACEDVTELTEKQLNTYKVFDEGEDPDTAKTFAEILENTKEPCLLCSTEY